MALKRKMIPPASPPTFDPLPPGAKFSAEEMFRMWCRHPDLLTMDDVKYAFRRLAGWRDAPALTVERDGNAQTTIDGAKPVLRLIRGGRSVG